jgi:hypothetical protein
VDADGEGRDVELAGDLLALDVTSRAAAAAKAAHAGLGGLIGA